MIVRFVDEENKLVAAASTNGTISIRLILLYILTGSISNSITS